MRRRRVSRASVPAIRDCRPMRAGHRHLHHQAMHAKARLSWFSRTLVIGAVHSAVPIPGMAYAADSDHAAQDH